ncbi:Uncharacterised protein [Zhongshania aliphaticivorans]|uniref:MSMEG_0570 family protein n=1 Tax=Zhongshania aliphaticivorans TaxID=1470434 RepID=A0A5S9NR74_9GAMM|nr:MSMEG_0570 family nitrogen starvation response protein [Zhongshania aliphaticivorans]CAA0092994.1 Uncharacterised protein [Zhongshania aliphaticivorans]CAA0110706.1 Uncharacterised protein [Zhongshania aliphaticivorans]
MPALNFTVRWPDNSVDICYSPSTVLLEHLKEHQHYPLNDFLHRTQLALNKASDRVEQKYGYQCSSAMDQLARIKTKAKHFGQHDNETVEVISITP